MGQVVQTAKHAKIRHVPRQKPSAEALAAGFAHSARTCIVLREPFPKEKMIRFAISPDGLVTPDILENLPGRGLWVFAKPDIITRAIKQNAFARAGKANTKKPITLPDDLMQMICTILAKRLIGLISLSRRNGRAICGFERIKTNLPLQRGQLLLQASDGSPNQLKKINHPENHHAALMCLTSAELGLAIGLCWLTACPVIARLRKIGALRLTRMMSVKSNRLTGFMRWLGGRLMRKLMRKRGANNAN